MHQHKNGALTQKGLGSFVGASVWGRIHGGDISARLGRMSTISTGSKKRGRAFQAKQEFPAAGVWQQLVLLEQGCLCLGDSGEAEELVCGQRVGMEGLMYQAEGYPSA